MDGYWQSEEYFKDIESTIRKDLQIKLPKDYKNIEMAKKINKVCSVAVHIRYFDKDFGGLNSIPINYYNIAFKLMNSMRPNAHYFIFSDRPDQVISLINKKLHLPNVEITVVDINKGDEQAYADLLLMSLCKNFIIANSTFSWWGAWLSENVGKVVIAPKFALSHRDAVTSWGFAGLIPKKWITI